MAVIPSFFLDSVVAIGFQGEAGIEWQASGFLYGRFLSRLEDDPDKKQYQVYLVTNRHVLENRQTVWLRFNPEAAEAARSYSINLVDEGGTQWWTAHPDSEVDVAVGTINVGRLRQDGISFSYFHSDDTAVTRSEAVDLGVSEGDGVFVLGFPMGLVGAERNYVIVRSGSLARVRDWLAGAAKSFLIDAGVFPGNSGGPVVLRPELTAITGSKAITNANLVGVVRGYVPYHDTAISVQTGRPRVIFEENSGLAAAHSIDQVEEAIDALLGKTPQTEINVTPEAVTPPGDG